MEEGDDRQVRERQMVKRDRQKGIGYYLSYVCDYLAMVELQKVGSANYVDISDVEKDFENLQKSIIVPLS